MKVSSYIFLVSLIIAAASAQCVSNGDCGSTDQPGLCVAGTCQCGAGYAGQLSDPAACSLVCSPPAVPDSNEFLVSPVLSVSAQEGNFVLNAVLDSYLKSEPPTVALLHPATGARCGVLPQLLGSGALEQSVNNEALQCDSNVTYRNAFAQEVAQACWEAGAPSQEQGAQYSITFNSYRTIVEVVQRAQAPFGQTASQRRRQLQSTTEISETFRRQYTINVATSFRPNSAPFVTTADGRVRYRLVGLDYDLLGGEIRAVVETQVQVEAKLNNTALDTEGSSGLAPLIRTQTGQCEASSPAGFCNQFHTIAFQTDPCQVEGGSLAIQVEFQCADGVTAPAQCGFPGLTNTVFVLNNMGVTYDSCARVVQYGIDAANSFLRLHEDVARTTPLSAPVTQGDSYYGRCSLLPAGDSVFESVTLNSISVWQVSSPANINLGNQLPAAFMTLLSPATNVNPSNPVWDFELLIDPTFFNLLEVYYLEAEVLLTFRNTGPLTRRLRMAFKPGELISHAAAKRQAGADEPQQTDGVASPTFRLGASQQQPQPQDEQVAPQQQDNLPLIVGGAVGGCALIALIIVAALLVRRRKEEDKEDRQAIV